MFRRTFTVVYKPAKNNYVLLPETYFKLVNSYEKGCLNLSYSDQTHYISWAPYSSSIPEYEIGINGQVAQAIGLKEGTLVKCCLVADVIGLYTVTASAQNKDDWELLSMSSNRIQATLLDQTKIVNEAKPLVVWINTSIYIILKIEKLSPNLSFGKIENNTEIIIAPFKSTQISEKLVDKQRSNRPTSFISDDAAHSNYKLAHSKTEMIRPLDHRNRTSKSDDKVQSRLDQMSAMEKMFEKEAPRSYQFRIVTTKWDETLAQIPDLFVEHGGEFDNEFNYNQLFVLTSSTSPIEYYVNVKTMNKNKYFPNSVYPTIEMNSILMKLIKVNQFERIKLRPKNSVLNFLDKIEVVPHQRLAYRELKDVEEIFKKFIIEKTKLFPLLLNQNQIVKLKPNYYVTVNLVPETLKFCLIDGNVLREARIQVMDSCKDLDSILKPNDVAIEDVSLYNEESYIKIKSFEEIVNDLLNRLKFTLCLNERNHVRVQENILLIGSYNCGKTTVCSKVLQELSKPPFNCYFDIFFCSRNKGRKPDSIQKDLRQIFVQCMNYNPSIVLLENLDVLTHTTNEHNNETDYFNKISNIIQNLIIEFTTHSAISVIATISDIKNLNKNIYIARGRHLFQTISTIPDLETSDREFIIKELCNRGTKIGKNLNLKKLSNLTEGYKIGDLQQLYERALFYALRNDTDSPMLTNAVFLESLKSTNNYCLTGIENNEQFNKTTKTGEFEADDSETGDLSDVAGMDNVIEILEEVLVWPSKFPNLYQNSPLRNQAGVLLFGPPGTGKTYLISHIAKSWNLRMISVKGPELLAKYIGQSEENVRNLFSKARSAKPCVLFFDEFDSLAPRRGHDSTGVTDRVVNQLLTELDGVEGLNGVIVVAATSRPELLDPALLRSGRLDRLVECKLPDLVSREKIFGNLTKTLHIDPAIDVKGLAKKMENYTGADIQSMLTTANMNAVKECLNRDPENIPDTVMIRPHHILEAFSTTRPSLSAKDIEKYKRIYFKFTNKEKNLDDFNFVAKRATLA